MLSVIIPTLNAAARLPACIAALAAGREAGLVAEIIVSDGGSRDGTVAVAESLGAQVTTGARGRGAQLQRGALVASGEWLLFLHADSRPAPEWLFAAEDFLHSPASLRRAGYFRFRLDDGTPKARRLERMVAWRCARFGLPWGDQGLLISRLFYGEVGGFRELPLMEDVDLVRRIGKPRLAPLPADLITSAERYRQGGYLLRPARNLFCLSLFYLGVAPRLIARLYG
jgi:rSAM/selenodomain-associated transferase 2